ncbi:Rh186 [macacine betaherpesvirus 3]|nr:Rh186 [macacine betaherpesvirus 3]
MPRSPKMYCYHLPRALLFTCLLLIVPAERCNKICQQRRTYKPRSGIPDRRIYGYTELDPECKIEDGRLHVNGIVLGDFPDPTWLHVYLRNYYDGKLMFAFSTNLDHPLVIMNDTMYRHSIHPMQLLEEAKTYIRDHDIIHHARLEHASRLRYQFHLPVSYMFKEVVIQVDHYYKPLFIKCVPEHELTQIVNFYLREYQEFHNSYRGKLYWICMGIVYVAVAELTINFLYNHVQV